MSTRRMLRTMARLASGGPSRSPLAGLVSHTPRNISQLWGTNLVVLGHRGAAGLAPENTLASMDCASDLGFGFEIDVATCRTGEVVVMHDDTVDRTTNGTGAVADLTWSELSKLDAGDGEPIPRLEDVLDHFGGKVPLDIELKSEKPRRPLARAVADAVMDRGLAKDVIITSFDPFMLEAVRRWAPAIPRGQIFGSFEGAELAWYERVILRNLLLTRRAMPDALMVEHTMVDATYLAALRDLGYPIFVWTPNSTEDICRVEALGVDGIITDHPDRV